MASPSPFAVEVRRLRLARNLTQAALAKQIRVSQPTLANLELGRNAGVGAAVLYRLCDALGVPCEHFRPFLTEEPIGKVSDEKAEADEITPAHKQMGKAEK